MIKITLITVTYNAEKLLQPTLDSVFRQNYAALEHIVIDGASTDDTAVVAKDYMERSFASDNGHEVRLLVEPDNGIYDAMNKGLQMATGDYVCFLNAGDSLPADDTIAELVANTGACFCFSWSALIFAREMGLSTSPFQPERSLPLKRFT